MDRVVAPIVYRTIFGLPMASHATVRVWVKACLKDAAQQHRLRRLRRGASEQSAASASP